MKMKRITIEGLGDETINVTAGELKELDCIRKSVTTQSKGGEIAVETAGHDAGNTAGAVRSIHG